MKGFWTCGPFQEAEERQARIAFKMEQMEHLMALIEEDKINQELILSGSIDEKLIASMIQLDIDKKIAILLGVPDGNEKKNDEISRKTLLKLVNQGTKNKIG